MHGLARSISNMGALKYSAETLRSKHLFNLGLGKSGTYSGRSTR